MDRSIARASAQLRKTLASLGISVSRLIIFGSAARGKRHADSDIDVAVISKDFERLDLYKRFALCGRALVKANIDLPMEVFPFTEREYEESGRGTFIGDEVKPKGVEIAL